MAFRYFVSIFLSFSFRLSGTGEAEQIIREECLITDSYDVNDEFTKLRTKRTDKSEQTVNVSPFKLELSAEAEPLTTVAGCINVSSGHFFMIDKDVVGQTIDPLPLTRYYDSASKTESVLGYGFGSQFPLWASRTLRGARHYYARVSEREGGYTVYESRQDDPFSLFTIDRRILAKGYTNLNRTILGGKGNFVNWKAFYKEQPRGKESFWKIHLGDGTIRYYDLQVKLDRDLRRKVDLPTKNGYLLTREAKPNGNELSFSYYGSAGKHPLLKEIKTINRTKTAVLNTLKFTYRHNRCSVTSSCGDAAEFLYWEIPSPKVDSPELMRLMPPPNCLRESISSRHGRFSYLSILHTSQDEQHAMMTEVKKPNGGFLKIKYDRTNVNQAEEGKVLMLFEPLGTNGEPIPSCRLSYADHSTLVFDALDQAVHYYFDENKRLIQRTHVSGGHAIRQDMGDFLPKRQIIRQERFEWSKKPGEAGWLRAKSVSNGKEIFHRKSYRYDPRGNVTHETVYGNLTGEKPETFTHPNETDHYRLEFAYSSDLRNLLIEKRTPEGCITRYDYLKGTNLPLKILHSYEGRIQQREFFDYDDNGQIVRTSEDNGSAVDESDLSDNTYRKLKFVQACSTSGHPSFGKPQTVTEGYRDPQSGDFIVLKRTEYSYDDRGNEIAQILFVDDQFCYETRKRFDERRRVIEETNAVGEITRYAYDEGNNKIEEEVIGSGKVTTYAYDLMNRLTEKREHHSNERIAVTTYQYDLLSRLICETDSYGNATTYSYDRLGNPICIIKPLIAIPGEQSILPTIRKTYNILGQLTSQTDENGFTTRYSYNVYGSPIHIIYPDHTSERYAYFPNGKLKQKWFTDGTSERYHYDAKGHLIAEETLDQQGQQLRIERYAYRGDLLLSKTDAMGFVTRYDYDGAGRKISENFHNGMKLITYNYDGLGRVVNKTLHSEDPQIETYRYDSLNRLIEKKLQDQHGTVYRHGTYCYDIHGNQVKKEIQQTDNTSACYQSSYHSDQTLQWKKDPLDNATRWFYDHHHTNGIGQTVQCRACQDPLGRFIHEADDAHHRLTRKDIIHECRPYSTTHFSYDPAGQQIGQQTIVTAEGTPVREYCIRWQYNSRGWKVAETELPSGKQTTFAYDNRGRLLQRNKPNGVSLHYSYNALGQLISKHSSDGTIHYTYEYDLHNNPNTITDHVHHFVHCRKYDALDRIIEEQIFPGILLKHHYDPSNRLTQTTLPNNSSISYHYTGDHLKAIHRLHPNGQILYTCHLPLYDKRGQFLQSITPAGTTHYQYDLLGRTTQITTPHWNSHQKLFDSVGNLLHLTQTDPTGYLEGRFSYDRYDHLATEEFGETNAFAYDSIGNCLRKNGQEQAINELNQLFHDGHSSYDYDSNGNLISQSHPDTFYYYDALNRLIFIEKEGKKTTLLYDAFDRCIQIKDDSGQKQLLYQGDKEIGSLQNGQIKELRLIHPQPYQEQVFALEIDQKTFFPVQDHRYNISALYRQDGSLAQWTRYTSFGLKSIYGIENLQNPWRFANRREINGLSLFKHRLYYPQICRWLTTDPIGFEDGLNLYAYVHNNPFHYTDPDGLYTATFELIRGSIGAAGVSATVFPVIGWGLAAIIGSYLVYEGVNYICEQIAKADQAKTYTDEELEEHERLEEELVKKDRPSKGSYKIDDGKKKGAPGPNTVQNKQANDAKREIEKDMGRKLTKKEGDKFHDEVHGQNYNYKELVQEGELLFP